MTADIFVNKSEGDGVEISVVKHGLSSGVAHRYHTVEKARDVLAKFGLDPDLRTLSKVPPSFLLRLPTAEIADEVLRSLEFTAAVFQAA